MYTVTQKNGPMVTVGPKGGKNLTR